VNSKAFVCCFILIEDVFSFDGDVCAVDVAVVVS